MSLGGGAGVGRRKQAREEAEITVWPSSFPDGIAAVEAHGGGESVDSDELGSHFLHDAVEPSHNAHPQWDAELGWDGGDDEPHFDAKMGAELLRSFGLKPMPKRTTTRPKAHATPHMPKLSQPRLPPDLEEMMAARQDVDLTEETIREASLLDEEGEEEGEVRSPSSVTEDVHTHGKRRGGHARTSLRPPRMPRER
jgi:hypothetical protein